MTIEFTLAVAITVVIYCTILLAHAVKDRLLGLTLIQAVFIILNLMVLLERLPIYVLGGLNV